MALHFLCTYPRFLAQLPKSPPRLQLQWLEQVSRVKGANTNLGWDCAMRFLPRKVCPAIDDEWKGSWDVIWGFGDVVIFDRWGCTQKSSLFRPVGIEGDVDGPLERLVWCWLVFPMRCRYERLTWYRRRRVEKVLFLLFNQMGMLKRLETRTYSDPIGNEASHYP